MSEIVRECRRLCLTRCLKAVALSIAFQFVLLTVFVYLVNFQLLHPIVWLKDTLSLVFSVYTWFSAVPLLVSVALYGLILGKLHLAEKRCYTKRVYWLRDTLPRKLLFLAVHILVGLLTAWLYTSYMHTDYQRAVYDCFGSPCLNSRFVFLIYMGVFAGVYHFCKENWRHEPVVEYPVIPQPKWIRLRTLLYSTLYKTLLKSFVPTLAFAAVYWLISSILNVRLVRLGRLVGSEVVSYEISLLDIATDMRLLCYGWLLVAQILSNMNLMHRFFSILLGEQMSFPIERQVVFEPCATAAHVVTLADALSDHGVPVVQHLACQNFQTLATSTDSAKRSKMFELSTPGSHPYNWQELSKRCLALIQGFTASMQQAITGIEALKKNPIYATDVLKQPTKVAADKILMRQYNQMYGIRNMVQEMPPSASDQAAPLPTEANNMRLKLEQLGERMEAIRISIFRSIPFYETLFGDLDAAQTLHLLENSQHICWLCQATAGILAASLTEDTYGVVQGSLASLLHALLDLKMTLDKLNNVNLNGRKFNRNFINLKSSVKRSLYKICSVFGPYLTDVSLDPEDSRNLQPFERYQET